MKHSTYPYALDPFVAKNPFRHKLYEASSIPGFSEVRSRLPVPVLEDRPLWDEMYWRAWEIAWSNLRRPRPSSGFTANFLDTAYNENTFMWDSAFMMQFGLYGRRAFNFMGTLDNFYAKQHDDGLICREINTEHGGDFFYPFDPNGTGPNILAWAEWRYYRATGDDSRLGEVFWPLMGLHRWFKAHRTWPSGLYWATGLSSGMDNQTRVPNSMYHHQHWTWVDASLQAGLSASILSQMAVMLDQAAKADPLVAERETLRQEIGARLWNEEAGFYQDVDPHGRFSKVKSLGAYWALLEPDMVSSERMQPFLSHLHDSKAFKRPHRVPSQSADSDGYEGVTGDYWRGGVWAPTNYMLLKGLRQVKQEGLAHEIALNHLENVASVFERTDTFWENYAPETADHGEPAKPNFVGWTGLTPIAILLEDVLGVSVDWPQRRVVWDRRLDTERQYGVRNYPLGPNGTLDLVGDSKAVIVTTTVPFTLTIQCQERSIQRAISPGTIAIDISRRGGEE